MLKIILLFFYGFVIDTVELLIGDLVNENIDKFIVYLFRAHI